MKRVLLVFMIILGFMMLVSCDKEDGVNIQPSYDNGVKVNEIRGLQVETYDSFKEKQLDLETEYYKSDLNMIAAVFIKYGDSKSLFKVNIIGNGSTTIKTYDKISIGNDNDGYGASERYYTLIDSNDDSTERLYISNGKSYNDLEHFHIKHPYDIKEYFTKIDTNALDTLNETEYNTLNKLKGIEYE